jgi:hypothetical protein
MKDLEKTLLMYKTAFPENPVFSSTGRKKEKLKKSQQQQHEEETQ